MAGETIKMYGAMWCPDCVRSKQFLSDQRIPFEWIDIDADEAAAAEVRRINDDLQSVPTILFEDGSSLTEPTNDELARKLGLRLKALRKSYELIIVGAGPAGLTAAIYAGRDGFECLVVDGRGLGGQAARIPRIENYPGFPEGLSGAELAEKLTAQARLYGVELLPAVRIQAIRRDEGSLFVETGQDDRYLTKAVLIATGSRWRRLGVPGEEQLIGKGIHFCATCDGPFYRGADEVLVIGGGNSGVQEAVQMSRFAKRVRLFELGPRLTASKIMQERLVGQPQFEVRTNVEVLGFEGTRKLEGVAVRDKTTGKEETLHPEAAFVLIGPEPNTAFLRGTLDLDADGFVVTDGDYETSLPGVFAAGDVRSGSAKQVGAATGEGIAAMFKVRRYLEEPAEVR